MAPGMDFIPHSVDAEHAAIGAILRNGAAIDDVGTLKPEHFYVEAHRIIFSEMMAMVGSGREIDIITLAERIEDHGKTEITGGLPYLGQIASNTAGTAIRRYSEIVQNKATERALLAAAAEIQAIISRAEPTNDKLNKAQALVMSIHESRQTKEPRKIGDALADYVATFERRFEGESAGISTGLVDLDKKIGGLKDGNLIIVAGRPSMGKSAFTNGIAIHAAKSGNPTAIMSMEMTEIEQLDRIVATLGRVPLDEVLAANLAGETGDRIYAAFAQMAEIPLFIDEEAGLSVQQVASKARQLKRKHGLRLLVVDALGLMDYDANKAVSELGAITRALKVLGKELGIPIILLCQLSRKCEERTDKRPIMSDLRDSGNIEQDGDVIIMLYRDEYYNPDSPDKGVAECLIRKARQGKTGVVPLAFIGEQTRFDNFAGSWIPSEEREQPQKTRRFA